MKKLLVTIFAVLCLIPMAVNAKSKVKVYIFEAGGCPACEAELEYLEGLSSNGEKFEIVRKELYVDHVDWAQGKDYALGKKVAEAFYALGFENATYQATPFVVVSDIYAASGANMQLETVIDEAYEKGDQDVVKCFADGKTDCLDHLKEDSTSSTDNGGVVATLVVCTLILLTVYLVKSSLDTKKIIESSKRK